jgi:hypothetical protein
MVLNAAQLKIDLGVDDDEFVRMQKTGEYLTFLHKKREVRFGAVLEANDNAVKGAEKNHYRTLAYAEAIRRGDESDLPQIYDFLLELNGFGRGGSGAAFSNTNLKQTFIDQRKNRVKERQKLEKNRRGRGKRRLSVWGASGSNGQKPDMIETRQMTYYELLGVQMDASSSQISREHQRLTSNLQCQDEETAAECLQLITHARNTLLDDGKRAQYNLQLTNSADS